MLGAFRSAFAASNDRLAVNTLCSIRLVTSQWNFAGLKELLSSVVQSPDLLYTD